LEQIDLTLALAMPGAGALHRLARDVRDPRSPEYGRYLTAAELGARFGLSLGEIGRVRRALETAGFQVLGGSPQRTALHARGRAALVSAFFGVSLHDFATPEGLRYHAPSSEPIVPAELEGAVASVLGLSSEPAARRPRAVPADGLRPIDAGQAYGIEPLWRQGIRGEGQTVAVVSFDSFRDEDIAEYDRFAGIEDAPAVRRVRIRGGAPLGRNAIEVSLDIEVVRAIAPGARIVSYEAPNSILYWPELLGQIVADGEADVVSVSWGNCEPAVDEAVRAAAERELELLAAQGISVFVASGDRGAYDCFDPRDVTLPENRLEVTDWPASSPHVVAVGGTRLSVRQNGAYLAEEGWEDAVSWSGTGGGLSSSVPRPAWQRGPGVLNKDSNGMRQVPDVAGPADCDSAFFIVYPLVSRQGDVQGVRQGPHGCGTSAAAPFWAAVAALLRDYAGRDGAGEPGFLGPVLYDLAAAEQPYPPFHDVMRGGNLKWNAAPGWDYATGLGSPDVWNLARDLVAYLRER
jgi:kumamolisin